MTFISGYCSIRANRIIKDHQLVVEGGEDSLSHFLNETYDSLFLAYPKFYKMDSLGQLGIISSELLLAGRDLIKAYSPGEIAVVLSNSHGSLDTDLRYFETLKEIPSPSLFVYTLPNIVIGEICIRHGFKGENAFFVFEKFETAFVAGYVDQLLNAGPMEACLAGWIDVLGDRHDVFLYLAEKHRQPNAIDHTAENLLMLYHSEL